MEMDYGDDLPNGGTTLLFSGGELGDVTVHVSFEVRTRHWYNSVVVEGGRPLPPSDLRGPWKDKGEAEAVAKRWYGFS